ncbi:MAG: protoheme IX farnesyltransferase [Burkholderiales bacterium]|nr:protoheme IX farnesyltransferase [Burkholderiales bacterium]
MDTTLTRPHAAAAPCWLSVIGIFKLRIAALITLTALAGLALVPAPAAAGWQVAFLALAVLMASAGAGAFNQYVEADGDRRMKRTRDRAFASGALPRSTGWLCVIAGMIVIACATAAWAVNGLAALFILLGAATYGGLYTLLLKRRTAWNIVIGGLSGSFAVLAGAAAAGPQIPPQAWALALVLFFWTPPHFWSLAIASEADYRAAGVPMLPVVVGTGRAARIVHASTLALVASSLLLPATGAGWLVGVGALAGGAHFLSRTRALARAPGRETAMASFVASMTQLGVLLLAVFLDAAMR